MYGLTSWFRHTVQLATFLAPLLCVLGGCDRSLSQTNDEFESRLEQLKQMFLEYNRIPVKRKSYGTDFAVWKDQVQLQSFYENKKDEFLAMDKHFLELTNKRDDNIWWDDAAFSRAVLHMLWTAANPDSQTMYQALVVLNSFANLGSTIHLEKITKETMQDAFLNTQEGFLSPNLSFERNAQLALIIYSVQLFVKTKEYDKAILQIQHIEKMFPTSGYSQQFATGQLEAIRSLKKGKPTLPDTLPK